MELRYKEFSWKGGSRSPLFAILFFKKEKPSGKWKHEAGNDDGKQKERKMFLQKIKKERKKERKKENNMHSEMNLELRYEDNYNGKRWKFQL